MGTGYQAQVAPRTGFLTQDHIEELHLAAVEILKRAGVLVLEPEAVGLLRDAEARVSEENVPGFRLIW